MKSFFFLFAGIQLGLVCSCNNIQKANEKGEIVIFIDDKIKKIILKKNDSVSVNINLDSLVNIISIIQHQKKVINGMSYVFYPNGNPEKIISSRDGIRVGHSFYFYESGSIKRELYYCNGVPSVWGGEYWDGNYSMLKYSIHFTDNGKIDHQKIYDSLGVLLKDSIPIPQTEYSTND